MSLLTTFNHRSGGHDDIIPYLCGTIEQKLYHLNAVKTEKTVTKVEIINMTADTLRNFDPAAYVAYTARYQQQLDAPAIRRALRPKK